jgi:cysteine desulfurase
MVSAGSACSSGKVGASSVLMAMGLSGLLKSGAAQNLGALTSIDAEKLRLAEARASSAVRASGGWATTPSDWDRFADVWTAAHQRHARRKAVA